MKYKKYEKYEIENIWNIRNLGKLDIWGIQSGSVCPTAGSHSPAENRNYEKRNMKYTKYEIKEIWNKINMKYTNNEMF